jgi:hypothetical protein
MDNVIPHIINGDMLLSGCFCGAGGDPVHFFAAAIHGNALVPDHSDDIAAMFANIELLFHNIPPSMGSVS